jgi:PAS domain S-box-containing protein
MDKVHLKFLENMDNINRAIRENNDLEQMMNDVLDVVLAAFECDRAGLFYPCDPEAATWQAPMERMKPEWPGTLAPGIEVPMDPDIARVFKTVLASHSPVGFGPGNEYPLPSDIAERFNERSQLATAIYPKEDKPYMFVIHQCSRIRVWTHDDRNLLKEIGRRLEDRLAYLLMNRNLVDSEQRYRMVFENSPVSIWEEDFSAVKTLFDDLKKQGVVDIEAYFDRHPETVLHCAELAKIVDVNRAALSLHGAANKEELLAGLMNTFTPRSLGIFRRELVCLWNGETEMTRDAVVKTLAGDLRDVTVCFSVCPGHEETLSKVLVSLIDITERKRIEEALGSSEAELRSLIKAMTDIIFVGNSEGRYLKIVDTSPSLLYKPPNELLGKTLHEVFPKDQADFFLNHIKQALKTQQSVNFEYSLPIGNKEFWFNATISPMSDDKTLMVARDITERKQTEEELAKYREHLEELVQERTLELEEARNKAQQYLDIAGVILVAIDTHRRVTLINQKGCEVLESTPAEIIGKDWFETFVPENVRRDVLKGFLRFIAGEVETAEYFENPVLTQGGQERLVAWHNVLLRDGEGRIAGTLSSGEDITERRRIEKQIRNLNLDLQKRAAALEAANKELDAFAYSVSHDLRAPLRHIDGFLELLKGKVGTALDEQSRHYMDTISNAAQKMGLLIDDLLSFSRMGRHIMSFQQVDLGPLVRDIIVELEPDTAGRNIAWRIDELPVVGGDPAMMRIVLVNLITNALKFTRPRPQAQIEIGSLSDRSSETVIFVRDNGVGFDMTYKEKLFGVFQRLHHTDEFEGTGIGLANVHRIIARHGGRTWAQGEPDRGAAFYFALPRTLHGGGDEKN